MAAGDDGRYDLRSSAFDVLVHRSGKFLATFYVCWIALTALLSYARAVTAENPPSLWTEVAIIVIVAAALCSGISIPLAFAFSEGIPMVIAKLRNDRVREEGRQEGRQEANQAWEAWLERREAAERDGRPFTELPPSRKSTHSENSER